MLFMSITNYSFSENQGALGVLDAVRQTLSMDTAIKIQEAEKDARKGSRQSASGAFDLTLQSSLLQSRTLTPFTEAENNIYPADDKYTAVGTALSGKLSKNLRTGQVVSVSGKISRNEDKTRYTGGNTSLPANLSSVVFSITQPITGGGGAKAVSAAARTKKLEYEASIFTFRHVVSQRILGTVQAYWNYVYAVERLVILKDSEKRALELAEKTEKLIEADEVPAADMNQMLANLEYKRAFRISGEQVLFEARQMLGFNMGLSVKETDSLLFPEDSFKDIEPVNIPGLQDTEKYINIALEKRNDYLSCQKIKQSAKVMTGYYKAGILPQIDMILSAGRTGLREGNNNKAFFSSLTEKTESPNYEGNISFTYPFGNDYSLGRLNRGKALERQSILNAENTRRTISTNISIGVSALYQGVRELKKSKEAYRHYEISLKQEKIKYTQGSTTILDVISYEERTTDALLRVLSAQRNVANAIVKLRYETATVIDFADEQNKVNINNLITIPEVE